MSAHERRYSCFAVWSLVLASASAIVACRHSAVNSGVGNPESAAISRGTWTTISTYFGTIDVPCGWEVSVQAEPSQPTPKMLWLFPERGFLINVLGIDASGASELGMAAWVVRFNQLGHTDIAPSEPRTFDSPPRQGALRD